MHGLSPEGSDVSQYGHAPVLLTKRVLVALGYGHGATCRAATSRLTRDPKSLLEIMAASVRILHVQPLDLQPDGLCV